MLKTFKDQNQMKNKYPEKNRIPNGEIITWKISLKDTSSNEISIKHAKKEMSNPQKRGWFQTNQALYKVS